MKGLERVVEWLRPFVETKAWDYYVVWKLGDDPSRFIEWMDCCCVGGYGHVNVKEERDVEHHLNPLLCKDSYSQHPVRTMACQALSQLPSSMPLYSGDHGEVVISNQPRWINHGNASFSDTFNESIGTRVLIPVEGGLIELFVAKHIPKDQKTIEFITAQCNFSLEQKARNALSYTSMNLKEHHLDPLPEEYLQHRPPSLHLLSFIPRLQVLPPVTHSSSYPSVEGSSSSSNPLNEHPSFVINSDHIPQRGSLKQSIGKSSSSKKRKYKELKQQAGLVSSCGNVAEKEKAKVILKEEKEQYLSKNLVTERNRRNRIKEGLFALRALVPKITKMDRPSILGDAIEYIEDLQKKVKIHQDELRDMEEEGYKKNKPELKISIPDRAQEGTTYLPPTEQNQDSSSFGEKMQTEVQVEVNQIGKRDFLIKILCEQKQGGFTRLMETITSLGLQVADANVTTLSDKVLNILKVEANKDIQLKKLRDSLLELCLTD